MTEAEEKAAFAALLLKTPSDPFKAALALFPDNVSRALRIATEWPRDSLVIEEQGKLVTSAGDMAFLPSKADLARLIWGKLEDDKINADEFAKLGKLYAEVRGFIDKPINNTNIQVNNVQRVVEMPVYSSSEHWEAEAAAQQRELLANARTRH